MFLWKQSQKRESPFKHNSYGVYAIKPDVAVQLDLFWDMPDEDANATEEKKENKTSKNKAVQTVLFKSQY
jgi:hypothetical protein